MRRRQAVRWRAIWVLDRSARYLPNRTMNLRVLTLVRKLLSDLLSVCDPVFLALALRRAADAARARRHFRTVGGSIGPGASVVSLGRLEVGTGAVVQSGCLLHCGGLDWSDGAGRIRLGERCYVGHDSVLYGAGGLYLGRDVLIGPGVILTSQGHHFDDPGRLIREQPHLLAPVRIGDDVWIGAGAVVLPGVTVGDGAIVAAGAVVSSDVAPYHVVAGVPARSVRERPRRVPESARGVT
jgi:carbonic anhydrase/acetyltransferase-like protein (isoleucine patch superfamily)